MGLIKKQVTGQQQKEAFDYLYKRLESARYRDQTMQEYFKRQWRSNCYYYSTYVFLCMQPTDRLVRGKITLNNSNPSIANYEHGWVEFEHNGNWWVYDDHYAYPIPLEDWYEMKAPYEIQKKFTQGEFLEYILSAHSKQVSIAKNGVNTTISTEDILDLQYNIPLYYADIYIEKGEIKYLDVEVRQCAYHF